jgi:hypothetical protein
MWNVALKGEDSKSEEDDTEDKLPRLLVKDTAGEYGEKRETRCLVAISRRDGLELDLEGAMLLPERGEPGDEGGREGGDCSAAGAGVVCSNPSEAISSTNEGKDAICTRY